MKANEVLMMSKTATEAMDAAAAITNKIDQDWEHEATLYTFDDDSVLVVSGPQCNAYLDIHTALQALNA